MFHERLADEAPVVGQEPIAASKRREEAQEAGYGQETGQHVRDGHRDQDDVGGVAHRLLREDDTYETVRDKSEGDQDGGDVAIEEDGVLPGVREEGAVAEGSVSFR